MPMKVVECLSCIFASELPQDNGATGMCILEVGYIVDLMIDNRPEAFVGGVLPAVRMWMSCLRTHVITLATSSLVKGAILGLARRESVFVRYERIQSRASVSLLPHSGDAGHGSHGATRRNGEIAEVVRGSDLRTRYLPKVPIYVATDLPGNAAKRRSVRSAIVGGVSYHPQTVVVINGVRQLGPLAK